MKQKPLASVLVLVLAMLCLSACSSSKKDEVVVWYTGVNPAQNEATIKAFNKLHPDIRVQALRMPSGDLSVRYSKERSSGGASADVLSIGDPTFFEDGAKKGWWDTSLKKPADWPADAWNQGVAKIGIVPIALGYNTKKVAQGSAPQGWKDILDPQYKGHILFADPRNVPSYLALMQLWSDEYGINFLKSFAAQKPQLVDSIVPGNQNLGAGAADLLVPDALPALAATKATGAPIELVDTSPTTGVETFSAVSNNARNPKAAGLFFDFLLSSQGQANINGNTAVSVLGQVGDTGKLPAQYIPLEDLLTKANTNRSTLLAALGLS